MEKKIKNIYTIESETKHNTVNQLYLNNMV